MKTVRLILTALASASLLFLGCQTGGGGGGKKDAHDEEDIKAVVEKVIKGFLEQTEEAFQDDIFPHISDDYSYAGFDKQALEDDMLQDLEDEERLDFGEATIEQDVDVNGKEATDEAQVQADVSAPWMEEDFGFVPEGQANIGWRFELAKEDDGKWRITAIKSEPTSFTLSGACEGCEDALPVESKLSVSPADEVAPGGSVSMQGSVELNTDDYSYFGWFALEWYDFIPNLYEPEDDPDSIYFYDFKASKGSFDLEATLPDSGRPEGLEIPGALNLGDDAVSAQLAVGALDGSDVAALLMRMWVIPLRPFKNEDLESCDNEPLDEENHSGIWLINIPGINVNQTIDFTIEGSTAAGWVSFISHDTPASHMLFPVSGEMTSDDEATLTFVGEQGCPPDDPLVLEYDLNFTGTTGNGEFSISGCGETPSSVNMLLVKLSNRCEYITDYEDILGDWAFVDPDSEEEILLTIAPSPNWNCYDVTLNEAAFLFMCRAMNTGWTLPVTKNGMDFGFAFHDADSGLFIISDYNSGDYTYMDLYRK